MITKVLQSRDLTSTPFSHSVAFDNGSCSALNLVFDWLQVYHVSRNQIISKLLCPNTGKFDTKFVTLVASNFGNIGTKWIKCQNHSEVLLKFLH